MSAGFRMKMQDKPCGRLPLIRDWDIEMTGSLKDLFRDLLLEIPPQTVGMEIMLEVTGKGKMLLQDFSGTSYSAFNRRYRHVKELSDLFHGPLA